MEQSELRTSRSVLRTLMNEFLNERESGFEFRLRFCCVSAHDIDARLKIAFRQRNARLRIDRVERGVRQRFLCAARISVHQAHIPACESDHASGSRFGGKDSSAALIGAVLPFQRNSTY